MPSKQAFLRSFLDNILVQEGLFYHFFIFIKTRFRGQVPRVDFEKLSDNRRGEGSDEIRVRVEQARQHPSFFSRVQATTSTFRWSQQRGDDQCRYARR